MRTPRDLGLAYEDVQLRADDGTSLHAWWLPASTRACGSVLFLHGNAENISTHIASVHWLPGEGFNVLLLDYRGYGMSAGEPSLPGLQADIAAGLRYLSRRADINARALAVFGQSLGAAAAIPAVARSPWRGHVRAFVADSAFASYRGIVREKLAGFWLTWPFQWLARTVPDDLDPVATVSEVSPIPLLLVHGTRDPIVPPAHGERLYAAARAPKTLWRVDGAGHIQAFQHPQWRARLAAWLRERVCPGRAAP